MRPFVAISGVTFTEVTRQPAYGIVVLTAVVVQALSPVLAMFGIQQDLGLMKEFSVSTVLLVGLILVGLGTSTVMGRELEAKATHTLLAKPVSASAFLTGRFAGLVGALGLAMYPVLLVMLLAARQGPPVTAHHPWDWPVILAGLGGTFLALILAGISSYRHSRPLSTTALTVGSVTLTVGFLLAAFLHREWVLQPFGSGFDPLLAKGVCLAFLGTVLLCSVTVLLSLLVPRGALVGAGLVFLSGLALGGGESPWICWLPALEVFWVGDVFYGAEGALPFSYLLEAALYAFSYSLVCLLIGSWVLSRRDVQ